MPRQSRAFARVCALTLIYALVFSSQIGLAQQMASQKAGQKAAASKKTAAQKLSEEQRIIHLLDRITFGPRPGDVERVQRVGWERFLDEQLHPERIPDAAVEAKLKDIPSIHLSSEQIAAAYPPPQVVRELLRSRGIELPGQPNAAQNQAAGSESQAGKKPSEPNPQALLNDPAKRREIQAILQEMGYKPAQEIIQELQQAKILRAVYGERQLQEVMADFWMNHFNVFAGKGADRWLITSYERDTIRPRVFDKFENLLRATAESPAMLFYLDNWLSATPNVKVPERGQFRPKNAGARMRRNQALGSSAVDWVGWVASPTIRAQARSDKLRCRSQRSNQNAPAG
jgi:uncharacterized protein (DUF1800 family)